MNIPFTLQTQDPEIIRENFKKIKFYLEAVTASGSGEVIFFTNADSLVLDWTLTRKALFGDFPSTEIWIDFNGVYYKDDVPGIMDAPPPSLTTITFDFLGNTGAQGTGFLIIGNGGDTSTLSSVGWGTLTGTLSAQTDLQTALNLKLNTSDYNQHFVGKYTTLAALQAAYPTANAGDYGQVDAGSGHDVVNYNYDIEDGWIEGGSGSGATTTDGLPEGSTNLYFTSARVLTAAAFGTIAGTYAQGNDSRLLDGETAFTWGNHAGAGYLTSASSLAWAKITGTPTTLSGYGITDAYPLTGNPSGFLTSVPAQSFSSLTGKPTTISGYGITDAGTIANGGTGLTTYATGDILYASAANMLSKLSAGTNGYVLTLASGVPSWAAAGSSSGWSLSGNTLSAAASLGTLNNYSLTLIANSSPVITLTPAGTLVHGYSGYYNPGTALQIYFDVGTGQRMGFGMVAGTPHLQYFARSNSTDGWSWNKGGDLQTAGTNELMNLNAGTGILTVSGAISATTGTFSTISASSLNSIVTYSNSNAYPSVKNYFYNAGAGQRVGIGLQNTAFNIQNFGRSSDVWTWNTGGDMQTAGTNQLMLLSSSGLSITNSLSVGTSASVGTTLAIGSYINCTYNTVNMYHYNAGAGQRMGFGTVGGTPHVQFFVRSGDGWSWNLGGDIQTAGTNELMRLTSYGLTIGTTTEQASSIFTTQSTTKGSLPSPKMTSTQKSAIASPAEGLEVYDTTLHQKSYYNGTSWINI